MPRYSPWVGKKIKKILKEGIRRNTHKPVSKNNPRRKVSLAQAQAVAIDMAKRVGYKVPRRTKKKSH